MKLRHLALLAAASMAVSSATASAADQVPQLSVNARLVHTDGSAGSATRSPHPMVVAQGVTSYVFAADNLCGLGAANEGGLTERRGGHVWKVTRTGVAHRDGKLTFDLDWTRLDPGSAAPAASGQQRLTLLEGSTYLVDMVRPTTPGTCKAGAVLLEIEASAIEEPAFVDTVLTYDVWVTHQDADGRKQTKHVVLSGKQGRSAEFDFAPFRFDVPQLAVGQYDVDVVTRIMGALKGRLRDSGKVDLDLETRRVDGLERPDAPRAPTPRAGGRKTLELALGEIVEIELPRMSGFVSHVVSESAPRTSGALGGRAAGSTVGATRPAVTIKDGMLIVNINEFFVDDRFSLVVRVKKEDQD